MTDEQGAILEASICPFGAIFRNPPPIGATVLVQGVGVAGLSFIQSVKCFGAKRVIAAGRNLSRLADAKRFGADVVVNTREEDLDAVVRSETDGLGVDLSIDAAGAAATFANAIRLCASGGVVNLYGIPSAGTRLEIPTDEVIFRQLTLRGGTNNELAWAPLIDLIVQGRFNNADMVTHSFGFGDLPEAFDLVDRHPDGLIKAVVRL
jgi:L-iditol 2-dehydrogenase